MDLLLDTTSNSSDKNELTDSLEISRTVHSTLERSTSHMDLLSPYSDPLELSMFCPPLENATSGNSSMEINSFGLLTPTSEVSQLGDDFLPQPFAIHYKSRIQDPSVDAAGRLVNRYADFLGGCEEVDPDPDLVTLRQLRNMYTTRTLTPPPTPKIPKVIVTEVSTPTPVQSGLKGAQDTEDDGWVECSEANDDGGLVVRGWAPPLGSKYVVVEITFEKWVFQGKDSNVPPASCKAFETMDVTMAPTQKFSRWSADARHDKCVDQAAKRKRGARGVFVPSDSNTALDAAACKAVAEVCAMSSLSAPPIPTHISYEGSSAMPLRRSPRRASRTPTVLARDDLPPPFSVSPQPIHEEERKLVMFPRAAGPKRFYRPPTTVTNLYGTKALAFIPPHLAKSITQNSLKSRAEESERVRKMQEEEMMLTHDVPMVDTSLERNEAIHQPETPRVKTELGSPMDISPPFSQSGTPIQPEGFVHLNNANKPITNPSLQSPSQFIWAGSRLDRHVSLPNPPSSPTPYPIAVSAPIPLGKGRIASSPKQQELLKSLAASLAQNFRRTMSEGAICCSSIDTAISPDGAPRAPPVTPVIPAQASLCASSVLTFGEAGHDVGCKRAAEDGDVNSNSKRARLD